MKTITLNSFKNKSSEWISGFEKTRNDKYTDQRKLSKNTIEQYRTSIQKFIKYLEEKNVKQINKKVVLEYRKNLIDNFKPSTVNVRIVALNKFFYAHNLEVLTVKQVENKQDSTLDNIMTEEELNKMLQKCKELGKNRLALLIDTLANTGIRIEELKYFTAQNILSDNNNFEVDNKGKKRVVYLEDYIKEKLKTYCIEHNLKDDDVIFHGRNKKKLLNKSTIWKELKEVAERAEINKKFNVHSYRHIYARRMVNNGMSIDKLANILGHSTIEVTRIYTRDSKENYFNEINRILKKYH